MNSHRGYFFTEGIRDRIQFSVLRRRGISRPEGNVAAARELGDFRCLKVPSGVDGCVKNVRQINDVLVGFLPIDSAPCESP